MTSGPQQQTASQIAKTRNPINTSKKPKISTEGRQLKHKTKQAERKDGGAPTEITDGKGGTANDRGSGRSRTTAANPQDKCVARQSAEKAPQQNATQRGGLSTTTPRGREGGVRRERSAPPTRGLTAKNRRTFFEESSLTERVTHCQTTGMNDNVSDAHSNENGQTRVKAMKGDHRSQHEAASKTAHEAQGQQASDSAGGTTSARHHDAPEAGNPRGCSLPSHMCGLGEGANPPGPHALTPEREGACSPEMEQTRLEPWVGGASATTAPTRARQLTLATLRPL